MAVLTASDDLLVGLPSPELAGADNPWFDRFYFNLHPPGDGPIAVIGAGSYPGAAVVDGYACLAADGAQRNLRLSDSHDAGAPGAVGPLSWEVVEPLRAWRLRLAPNPAGFELDVTWTARTEPWAVDRITVGTGAADDTDFAHFFQSGRYEGTLTVDGERIDVGGWLGQRDRSRGLRRTRDRLGMHLWIAAQFQDACVGFNLNADREGNTTHCDGAVMPEDGAATRIVDARHALVLDPGGELESGVLVIELEDGSTRELELASAGRGIYMAGAGYGGWHGVPRGAAVIEHEVWALDGSVVPQELPMALTDKLCGFREGGAEAHGLAELAVSRSSSYTYRPTLT